MRNVKAALLLLFACAVSIVLAVYCGANSILSATKITGAEAVLSEAVPSFNTAAEPLPLKTGVVTEQASEPAAMQTAVPQTAKGRILSKTFGHSGVLTYGNIYVKNSSGIDINIENELSSGIDFKINKSKEPEILIVHTHATESFMQHANNYYTDSDRARTTDMSKNMTAVGDRVAAKVAAAGYSVIHDKTLHDYPSYSGSYTRAAKTINGYLKKHPTIKMVIDIHRDAISSGESDKVKPVVTIGGKQTAQVMLVQGSDPDGKGGFPNWRNNLRVAMLFHKSAETLYPGLMRPLLLTDGKYNECLTSGSILIEVGTDANSMDEALNSADLVGNALVETLNGMK